MWRIFSKKNRNYTIGGVIAFVVIVFVIYKYALKGTAIGNTVEQVMRDPTSIAGGYGKGWEAATYKGPHYTRGGKIDPITVAEGGTGRSAGEAISLN